MPINNSFFGAYQAVGIYTSGAVQPLICRSFRNNERLEASPENFIQGSPLAKIINIGKVSQTLEVDAPILVSLGGVGGTATNYDGRALLTSKISQIITNSFGATLPVVSKATLTVNDASSSVNLTLLSDGNPDVFTGIATIAAGNSGLPIPNAIKAALRYPTRVARFYDFIVSVGKFNQYVIEASFNFELITKEQVFLGAYDSVNNAIPPYEGSPDNYYYVPSQTNPDNTPLYAQGLQFPYIGVGGIKITGRGKAAVGITSTGSTNYSGFLLNNVAKNQLWQNSDVTLQKPGDVITTSNKFAFYVRDGSLQGVGGTNAWVDLFASMGIGITYQLNTAFNLNITNDLMTTDFEFLAFLSD